MKEIAKFYKGKKVFITGATGFKGSWLSYILKNFGSKVYSYSLKPHTKPSNFNLLKLDKKINCIYKDVRDKKVLQRALKTIDPDIIFHLAAQPLVKKSYKEPLTTFETNINGTINILESSRSLKKLKSLVIITSDKCYKNVEKKNGYSETDELGGIDPYSASKAAAENVCFSYLKSLIIDKGSNDGLVTNSATVTDLGIVGQVIEANPKSSKILLISDNRSAIDAIFQRSRDPGIVFGAGKQMCKMRFVSMEADVKKGDRIISSGMGGVFPKGLLIGTVGKIIKKKQGLFQGIEVVPSADLSRLEEMLVLLPD